LTFEFLPLSKIIKHYRTLSKIIENYRKLSKLSKITPEIIVIDKKIVIELSTLLQGPDGVALNPQEVQVQDHCPDGVA
jgi:hypothetical protein